MSEGVIARDGAAPGGGRRGLMAALRDPAVRMRNTDIFAALAAASLPWSTTPPAVFMALWLVALAFTANWRELLASLRRPACFMPLVFFALAVVGTLWAQSPWPERLHGINPVSKLLLIPLLIYHFERSHRGLWVLVAFVVSCALLLVWSYVVLVFPALKLTVTDGVPVKNYIDQSQEFALCMFALAAPALTLVRRRQWGLALACAVLMLAFFVNMMFVVSARTALVYMPVLLLLFAVLHLRVRTTVLLFAGAAVVAAAVWFSSPYLRERVTHIGVEYEGYQNNEITSTAQRLGYWKRSLKFIAQAPLVGNGTGATKRLFELDAVGKTGLAADVIGNPHNQTLNVAVQWGVLGCIVLYAMWIAHLLLFRSNSLVAYVGLLVVVENMVSSLLNSHLFDFHEGWMYVIGVGVAGGMALKARREAAAGGTPQAVAAAGSARS